jgi:hypothetical protein
VSPRYTSFAFDSEGRGPHFYCRAARAQLYAHFVEMCERPMRPPEPLALHEVEGAIFVNHGQTWCLYDRSGERIEASRLVRYAGLPQLDHWPTEPRLDSLEVDEEIGEPLVFRSIFIKHWGHFLLESIARLWPDDAHPELRGLSSLFAMESGAGGVDGRYAEFLDLAGVRLLPPFEPGRRVRLAKCYIPTQSFSQGAFADPAHLEAPRRVARRLLGAPARDDRPVYFSRTDPNLRGHAQRRMRNEAELEAELARRGARIVQMQALSLAEQVELMNAHRVFIGGWGSAFHNLMFRLDGAEVSTFVLTTRRLPRDYLLIDSVVGNAAHYLAVQFPTPDFEQSREIDVDVEATLSYLAAQGVV